MKQVIIFILVVIAILIGFGKYQDYTRFHSDEVLYSVNEQIDLGYHNKEVLLNYYEAIESLNAHVSLEWNANKIDVKKPEEDNDKTKFAVEVYAKKLAKIKFYEAQLIKSATLKKEGISNKEIRELEQSGISIEEYNKTAHIDLIKSMFNPIANLRLGEKSAFVFEIQKRLVQKGHNISVDGVFKNETSEALRSFEEKNKLFPDGNLNAITLDALLK